MSQNNLSADQAQQSVEKGWYGGVGVAIGACGLFVFLIAGIMGAIMYPVFSKARYEARSTVCLGNTKRIGMAMNMYTCDWDGSFPSTDGWNEKIFTYVGNNNIYHCPGLKSNEPGYAMNAKFASRKIETITSPDKKVLVFETEPGRNKVGGSEILLAVPRHADKYSFCYADGHARSIEKPELSTLQWE